MPRLPRCLRCGARLTKAPRRERRLWNILYDLDGDIAGGLCPQCQTPEEAAEGKRNARLEVLAASAE